MSAVGKVEMACNEVVDMVAMGHCEMAAVRAMAMSGLVPVAAMGWGACLWVLSGDVEPMFIDMVSMDMVQVSVVQIIDMAVMCHGRMAAVCPMLMAMLIMNGVVVHWRTPFVGWPSGGLLA